jgi:excisionase family DNA binding protein
VVVGDRKRNQGSGPLKFRHRTAGLSDDHQLSPLESHGEMHMERSKRTPGVNGIMDISEAADYLHIKKWTLYRLVKRGKIPGIKVGGQWRFKKEVLDEMFTQNAD